MSDRVFNVLFLCSRNSARSIMAEAIMNNESGERFRAYSAGVEPAGKIDPDVLHLIERSGYATNGMHPKTWDDPEIKAVANWDFVVVVCDQVGEEDCPVWDDQPVIVSWDIPDPVRYEGMPAERAAFTAQVFQMLYRRITAFTSLRDDALEGVAAHKTLTELGIFEDRPAGAPQGAGL